MQHSINGNWAQESHLSAQHLSSVHDLNYGFLDLAGTKAGGWSERRGGLPAALAAQVAPLSTAQRAAAANCPYALFDLRFADDEYWRRRLENAGPWQVADALAVDDDTANFV